MKGLKNFFKPLHTRTAAYVFFVFAALAFALLNTATWTHGWIAELYPLGENFISTVSIILAICMVIEIGYLIASICVRSKEASKGFSALRVIYTITAVFSAIAGIYSLILFFGLDSGFIYEYISRGLQELIKIIPLIGFAVALPLPLVFCEKSKYVFKIIIASLLIIALAAAPMLLSTLKFGNMKDNKMPQVVLQSKNLLENGKIVFESLKIGEKADAAAILNSSKNCWTAEDPDRMPAEGYPDINNSYVEIELAEKSTFNTAIIEELGNEVQYFRLQAKVDGEWVTIYQGEKIQSNRLCSFDAVTTDTVRLSIEKFRNSDTPAKIKSLQLYNEPVRDVEDFEVTAYQRLDGDVPSEILAKGEEYVNNYARFYNVYSTIIVFAAVHWDEQGQMGFGEGGEEKFAKELNALKEIIEHRPNKEHEVKIIVTTLADGTWSEIDRGVNGYMAEHWESIADKTIAFVEKYNLSGVDIDWEYPQTGEDWIVFDKFIGRLDDGIKAINPNAILSGALSAGALGMSEDTLKRFDQIQFMAYDGQDIDGYQSSLEQAQAGLQAFVDSGADIKKINIGIAAYGRPINLSPYWGAWRDLEQANYWDSKYYNVITGDQLYDGTFCSPALAGDKTAYALLCGAGGVMVFRVACDKTMDNPNSVACGIENTLNRYIKSW